MKLEVSSKSCASENFDLLMWIKPEHSKKRVGRAGECLIKGRQGDVSLEEAITILNNWRSAHAFPLNSIQNSLRYRAKKIDKEHVIAQRLKRISSIKKKLQRFPEMKLHRMQDIGGCRVILSDNEMVYGLMKDIIKTDNLNIIKTYNYLQEPKDSGYRGIHLISEYCGKQKEFEGLKIEIQIRSKIQHYWATAVEIIGTFTNQQLKASIGDEELLLFFKLISILLDNFENNRIQQIEIVNKVKELEKQLEIRKKLSTYSVITSYAEQIETEGRFLLKLDINKQNTKIRHFRKKQLKEAAEEYKEAEQKNQEGDLDIVLIEAKSIQELKKGYPNYFADSTAFIKYLSDLIEN